MTTARTTLEKVLTRHDRGEPVATISQALDVTPGWVYQILREHRPKRKRKAQTRVSETRRTIRGLAAQGIAPARIVFLMQEKCSRQYVYRELSRLEP